MSKIRLSTRVIALVRTVETTPYTDYSAETSAPAAWKVRTMIGKTIAHYTILARGPEDGRIRYLLRPRSR